MFYLICYYYCFLSAVFASDSSSNSHFGSEADDEGGESCWEGAPTGAIKKVIPWWEIDEEAMQDDDYSNFVDQDEENRELDLSLVKNQSLQLKQYENDVSAFVVLNAVKLIPLKS